MQAPEYVVGHGRELLEAATEQGLEGVVAKRLTRPTSPAGAPATGSRSRRPGRQEFVVGGWVPGQGHAAAARIGALLLGVHETDGSLRYAGRVGSGFSERELDRLRALLDAAARARARPSRRRPPRASAVFCEPRLVAEVSFSEWTPDGSLRHPVYLGLREDKAAAEVVREDRRRRRAGGATQPRAAHGAAAPGGEVEHGSGPVAHVEGHELKLSNLDKVLYPTAASPRRG